MQRSQGLRIESEGTGISMPLSEQVNLLGAMLGQVIKEQAGEELLELTDRLRLLCKEADQNDNVQFCDLQHDELCEKNSFITNKPNLLF